VETIVQELGFSILCIVLLHFAKTPILLQGHQMFFSKHLDYGQCEMILVFFPLAIEVLCLLYERQVVGDVCKKRV
jgi:hypothetical protein